MSAKEIVLGKLKKKTTGITAKDFPVGFRLSAVIFDLRKIYKILTLRELDKSMGYKRIIGRYILKGKR